MSPRRSKTICLPSGLTSTFIHVPSDVSNATFCTGPRSAAMSHFLVSGACPRNVARASVESTANAARFFMALVFVFEASPEIPARDRPVRPPRLRDLPDAIRFRPLPESVEPLDGVHDAEVVDREHVGP